MQRGSSFVVQQLELVEADLRCLEQSAEIVVKGGGGWEGGGVDEGEGDEEVEDGF